MKGGKEKDGYGYLIFLIAIVVVSWGVVPGLAKLGDLPGDLTTFYVNWIAVLAVALLITKLGKWREFRYKPLDYVKIGGLGVVWPLLYSIAYFEVVRLGGPALATILNYTWPAFCLTFAYWLNKKAPSKPSIVAVAFAVAAVVSVCFIENRSSFHLSSGLPVALGLFAAASQGFYSAIAGNDRWQYDAWVVTFVVEIVTAIGVTALVLSRGAFTIPPIKTIFYLGIIGAISNGIGFWAFLAGSQMSDSKAKGTWLIGMCLIPFAQVLLLPLIGLGGISIWKWVGVSLIAMSLLIHRLGERFVK